MFSTLSTSEMKLSNQNSARDCLSTAAKTPNRNLLFLGTSPISPRQVLVKLIVGDRYGTEAHEIPAKVGFAPAPLYGMAKVQGAPTAYVMDYFSPYDGWKTLHEHARRHDDVRSHILAPLRRIFAEMEKHDIVHGDFRPDNILMRRNDTGDDYELRFIGFDWAGRVESQPSIVSKWGYSMAGSA